MATLLHFRCTEAKDRYPLLKAATKQMKWACLAHLSQDNNTPDLAVKTHAQILGKRLPVYVATRYEATEVLEV